HAQYLRQSTALTRNLLLTEVHDRNEVLFYRLLVDNLPEMLPIVYTPTVGEAIENYSHEYRRPRGVYLSVDHPDLIEKSLGKLVVYTAAGGIDPNRILPVMLDVGTDRQSLLDDPLYIGNRHPRVSAAEYDTFIDAFVEAVGKLFPRALLHWEDIAVSNARRLLERYRRRLLTFNDDIQGTGAVNLAAVLAAVRATGQKLPDHRIVIYG